MTELITYSCPECIMHYLDKDTAQKCATWCKENKSCNIEITKLSVERATTNNNT
jgi:hypothetical protein